MSNMESFLNRLENDLRTQQEQFAHFSRPAIIDNIRINSMLMNIMKEQLEIKKLLNFIITHTLIES